MDKKKGKSKSKEISKISSEKKELISKDDIENTLFMTVPYVYALDYLSMKMSKESFEMSSLLHAFVVIKVMLYLMDPDQRQAIKLDMKVFIDQIPDIDEAIAASFGEDLQKLLATMSQRVRGNRS